MTDSITSLQPAPTGKSLTCTNTTARSGPTKPDPSLDDIPWYRWWVLQQFRTQPKRLLLCLPGINPEDEPSWTTYSILWDEVRNIILLSGPKSIDYITEELVALGVFNIKDNYEAAQSAKDLVFAVLGWQTMLYKPDFTAQAAVGYNIVNEMDEYSGETRLCLSQSLYSSGKDLASFLLGFGMMLPPRNYCGFDDDDDRAMFSRTKAIFAKEMNAHVLSKVCGVRIQWVDSLSCHLELDRQAGTLFVYRYPSFCAARLRKKADASCEPSILHCCGSEKQGHLSWASSECINELLQEILLSYRLIFGQHKRSRRVFRGLQPFKGVPDKGQDRLLSQLCGRKRPDCVISLVEREEYDLAGDFPHLRSKLVRLSGYAASKKPRSIRQLWEDKRDSTSWLAFWSVLIFGSLSILLGLIGTVFQILQYTQGLH